MTQTHLIVVVPLEQLGAARGVVAGYDAAGASDTFTAQLADPGGEVTHSWASWQLLDAAGVAAWKGAKVPGVRLFDGALRLPEEILAELNLSVAKDAFNE